MGVIPNREIFIEYQLGNNPQPFFAEENETLAEAKITIQDNFAYFEVAPPTLSNAAIEADPSGLNPNQFSYYNTDTEIFWFIHGILFLLKEFMISLR